jgi:hypothetical protein
VTTIQTPDSYTALPDEQTLAELPGRIHVVLIRQQVGF